jgi:hypothetical protein
MNFFRSSKPKEDIKDPEALAHYYSDTFQCHNFYLEYNKCMQRLEKKWVGKHRLHRQCLDHFDEYNACLVGIKQQQVHNKYRATPGLHAPRTLEQLHRGRQMTVTAQAAGRGQTSEDHQSRDRQTRVQM